MKKTTNSNFYFYKLLTTYKSQDPAVKMSIQFIIYAVG